MKGWKTVMEKMLYLLHVDWNWIKQRPQFMAESLAGFYDIRCVSPHWYNRKNLQSRNTKDEISISKKEVYGLPFAKKYRWVRLLNNKIRNLCVRAEERRFHPNYIYVTTPELYAPWMENYKGKIIYDCMDNHIALTNDAQTKTMIEKHEKELCNRADVILVSSSKLREYMIVKYRVSSDKILVVRNGYDGRILDIDLCKRRNEHLNVGYIGTISSWFDWDTILAVCTSDSRVTFHILGPLGNGTVIPDNEQIKYEGIVEHDRLYDKIKDYDALIMPFIRNEIVEAVDPVKLYEYINFGKDIISVYYDEIDRFGKFAYFYRNTDEFIKSLSNIRNSNALMYSAQDRLEFLQSSSWACRAREVDQYCKGYR